MFTKSIILPVFALVFCLDLLSGELTVKQRNNPRHFRQPSCDAYILDLRCPRGDRGPAGDRGQDGDPGQAGAPGPQGVPGATGSAGPMGPKGPTGLAGPQGVPGAQGPIGLTGLTGATGDAGATGPTGAQGPTGPAGATGPTGPSNVVFQYAYVYNTLPLTIAQNVAITFSANGPLMSSVSHILGAAGIILALPGLYRIQWFAKVQQKAVFGIRLNGLSVTGGQNYGTQSGNRQIGGMFDIQVTLVPATLTLVKTDSGSSTVDGTGTPNFGILLMKIA